MSKPKPYVLAAALIMLAAPAFAQSTANTDTKAGAAPGTNVSGATTSHGTSSDTMGHGAADQAFTQGMQTMQQQMASAKMTGKPDQDFVTMMIPHHQGAIAMAKTEEKYGKSAYLKRMARKIVASQSKEIKQMKRWQAKHPTMN